MKSADRLIACRSASRPRAGNARSKCTNATESSATSKLIYKPTRARIMQVHMLSNAFSSKSHRTTLAVPPRSIPIPTPSSVSCKRAPVAMSYRQRCQVCSNATCPLEKSTVVARQEGVQSTPLRNQACRREKPSPKLLRRISCNNPQCANRPHKCRCKQGSPQLRPAIAIVCSAVTTTSEA